ncbi:inositol monophosphatase [Mycobacterium gordonae]|uniref:inositol monophosphatase family protein n=1 Tax=Mycobacterium gordonae TaxID=1778 RepID=UPI0021099029|nr:inositol monophosphatase family protein [Mycobacterium gordonae]MCQ4361146.1 inositol monophosphatase [Mycobacterium gordonae]
MGDIAAAELMAVARHAAEAGARVAMHWRENAHQLRIEEKTGPRDLVSRADRESEDAIVAVLSGLRPDDGVLGEEHGGKDGATDVLWTIDPIDGTTNYLYGRSDWAVSVAALRRADRRVLAAAVAEPTVGRMTTACDGGGAWSQGRRLAMPVRDSLDTALIEVNFGADNQRHLAGAVIDVLVPNTRDVRRGGSAARALAQVATGRADAAWVPGLQSWDGAAGLLLVAEAGGVVGDLDGETAGHWPATGDVLAASPALWPSLHRLLAPVYAAVV